MIRSNVVIKWQHAVFIIIGIFHLTDAATFEAPADDWEITYPRELRFNVSWTVQNFSAIDAKSFESPIFTPPHSIDEHRFKIRLFPKVGPNKDMVAIFLLWDSPDVEKLDIKYKFRVKGRVEDWIIADEEQDEFVNKFEGWGFENRISRRALLSPKNSFLIKGSITFYVDIKFWEFLNFDFTSRNVKKLRCDSTDINALRSLSSIKKLYDTKKYSDVILVVNGRKHPVHKAILAAQSPVFETMFDKLKNHLVEPMAYVNGFDNEAFNDVLNYLYTGRIQVLDNKLEDILKIATTFKIMSLKKICEELSRSQIKYEIPRKILNDVKFKSLPGVLAIRY